MGRARTLQELGRTHEPEHAEYPQEEHGRHVHGVQLRQDPVGDSEQRHLSFVPPGRSDIEEQGR